MRLLSRLLVMAFVFVLNQKHYQAAFNKVDPNSVTVSGFSSGGAMAMQFHLVHSSTIHGVGIFGGLPYGCGYFSNSSFCHQTSDMDYVDFVKTHAWLGNIDPVTNVVQDNAFVFHGPLDAAVNPALGVKISNIYSKLGARVTTEFTLPAGHGFPTEAYGTPCDQDSAESGYLSNCSYFGAFEVLNTLYGGGLQRPSPGDIWRGTLTEFDQTVFIPPAYDSPTSISLDSVGFMYIPSQCDPGVICRLHVALHGCLQSRGLIGDLFVRNAGYLEVGEANNIIIVFPQAAPTVETPNGCWNWWGYLEASDYLTSKAPQIQTLYNIVNAFL